MNECVTCFQKLFPQRRGLQPLATLLLLLPELYCRLFVSDVLTKAGWRGDKKQGGFPRHIGSCSLLRCTTESNKPTGRPSAPCGECSPVCVCLRDGAVTLVPSLIVEHYCISGTGLDTKEMLQPHSTSFNPLRMPHTFVS